MNIHSYHSIALMQLVTVVNVDFWWSLLVVSGWSFLGVIFTLMLLFLEQIRFTGSLKDLVVAFWRFLKTFVRQLYSPSHNYHQRLRPYLWALRCGMLTNLFLWVITVVNLTPPNPNLDIWFWPGMIFNALTTVILSSIPLSDDSPLYHYGRLKQAVVLLAFLTISCLTVLIIFSLAGTTKPNQLILNQNRPFILNIQAWYLWSHPISCLLGLWLFFDYTLIFKTLMPFPRQFEKNLNFSLMQSQPELMANLRFLRAAWQLNLLLIFMVIFTGGTAGLIHSFSATTVSMHPLWLIGKLVVFIGLLTYCQSRMIEFSYRQIIVSHFKILLPLFIVILGLVLWIK